MAKINVPTNQAELEELLADSAKIENVIKEGQLNDVVKNYAANVARRDTDLKAQVKEQVDTVLTDFMQANGQHFTKGETTYQPGQGQSTAVYNKSAAGAAKEVESEFTGMHDFFSTIWHNAPRSREHDAKMDRLRTVSNAFSSNDGSSGGFLVPETMRSEILQLSLEDSVVRSHATVIPMSSASILLPFVDETSRVSSVRGGIVGYWTEEAGAATLSNATFGSKRLNAHKLTTYTEVPNELLADGIAFEAFVGSAFPQTIAFYEDDAFMNGNGVGQPEGYQNSAAAVVVTKESGQPNTTIVWENIVKMYSRMLPSSLNKAVWVVPPNAFPELATMALSVGTGGSAIWLNNGQVGPPMTILGRPVIVSEKAPTLGAQGDIAFVDMSYYMIGDRQAMTATSSLDYKFQQDMTAFKVVERVDGRIWQSSALTPKNNGSTLSSVVLLGAR
jgi:HK97 family phage major capsid protein